MFICLNLLYTVVITILPNGLLHFAFSIFRPLPWELYICNGKHGNCINHYNSSFYHNISSYICVSFHTEVGNRLLCPQQTMCADTIKLCFYQTRMGCLCFFWLWLAVITSQYLHVKQIPKLYFPASEISILHMEVEVRELP